ncbi:MAG: thiamine pyrophosphate-dependent dehydrogenase E1 component subunit alpha, partial [Candidatus Omnitrophica bacterium]|nr:thiamine pyrophosphate-dependent dehydrogenase E1 component subunit alpha [Candidatus Omnitrophota bacterium]
NHRSHAHYLAKGGDLSAMIAEFYCKATGCSHGRGGSMHLIDKKVGHYGSSAIVGGGISHGVGAALASKLLNKHFITVVFLGDAASEEGVFFESLNLAMLKKVPVLFVCENNRYSVCSPIKVRQANDCIAMRARAFDMPAETVDGMNFFNVIESAGKAIDHVRRTRTPYFLEYNVQRWRAHAGAGDPLRQQYRLPEDISELEATDPLKELESFILDEGIASEEHLDEVRTDIEQKIEEAFVFAQSSPLPEDGSLDKNLFV